MQPSTRRLIEQIKHCAEEALSVVNANEKYDHAILDLEQAGELITLALTRLRAGKA